MKIWINKTNIDELNENYHDAVIFNMLKDNPKSNLKTNFEDIWRRFSLKSIDNIYEDFLIIASSIFAVDRRIPRSNVHGIDDDREMKDNWTRTLEVNIPVLEIDKWVTVRSKLEKVLNFLSGDLWKLDFRETEDRYRNNEYRKNKYMKKGIIDNDFDCVSLFSGGLDSFCGALHLLEQGKKVCFVGCMEYNQLKNRMKKIYKKIDSDYPNINKDLIVFSTNPRVPQNINEDIRSKYTEDTSRSRSLLFISVAMAVASIVNPNEGVYIPENGFIGLNVPLTPSRIGSCSTRTTHVYFLKKLNEIFKEIDIPYGISNFYAYKTKGQIVSEFKENSTFLECVDETISCSHPTQGRMAGVTPINCGYCFPCMIRRASLNVIGYEEQNYLDKIDGEYKLDIKLIKNYGNPYTGRAKDLNALLAALHKYIKNDDSNYYKKQLVKLGGLSFDEVEIFNDIYIKSMEELKNMIVKQADKNDKSILEYIGMSEDNE
ncbi:Qat anti-phage system QueC-like protein QatC [Clostridium grantii]|uniref:7-cyano-7-deazaguanine synthase (Queuosine biosynthesis) n=1 Tax=Clostridium grantii DSM 8605 TaxID=1121316 RepID=A0A1M5VK60_9CLOT|nr:Qat anti-phage system QueC-like protein QatC [Clostridium grantii]SHH75639.1 7-cyano-7-deazaguanine synthase (queuosine biosynthesis) [Clostridium grantii DSM 8605]